MNKDKALKALAKELQNMSLNKAAAEVISLTSIKLAKEKNIKLYSFVPKDKVHLIKQYGLMSSKAIKQNKDLLNKIFENDKDKDAWLKRYDGKDITLKGPSVFFHKPSLKDIPITHDVKKSKYELCEIDYSKLKKDFPDVKIYGIELIPYENDEYEERKKDIESWLTGDDISELTLQSSKEAWKEYKEGYFAGNVPHGIVMIKGGCIPSEYLKFN